LPASLCAVVLLLVLDSSELSIVPGGGLGIVRNFSLRLNLFPFSLRVPHVTSVALLYASILRYYLIGPLSILY
jgi:hypothetical protein